ncbi:ABC transporter permease subunit (plasmid) [Agrobacterium leguminum]|uniref:ABC transporter permease subunit n=1 Tax=Agrobacterium leguminum TaxID=2792015 RepID=UPI00272C4ABC|nr:ABC transporter permease subunit [Agrobacterium leguminum]WLE01000.1 ABC transporter permease subunit [Agrobacterium leguminum]
MTAATSLGASAPYDRKALKKRIIRQKVLQVCIVVAVLAVLATLGYAIRASLASRGIAFSFNYLSGSAGFEISEGLTYSFTDPLGIVTFSSDMSNAQALVAGLTNTLKVAVLAIIFATVIGVLLGVGRLSTNWLIRQICFYFVEFVRNTPLLIQLTFWYVAVVLRFPPIADAPHVLGSVISQQGLWIPSIIASESATPFSVIGLLISLVLFAACLSARSKQIRIACLLAGAVALALTIVGGFPIALSFPEVGRFRASGGMALSPEFTAILIAISINSSAYLGEVVRGAIEGLPKGQWEAAGSLGFSRHDTIKDIVLPQVFRVVLPSFGNQYIGLAKNTSLGIAIGFPDLFNIYGTVANQTGRSLEGVVIVMLVYLFLSLTISTIVNAANSRLKIPGAR